MHLCCPIKQNYLRLQCVVCKYVIFPLFALDVCVRASIRARKHIHVRVRTGEGQL